MLKWEKCIKLDWSYCCSAIWISTPSPKSPTFNHFHWGLRPKLNMSKQDDTDNSHNRSNHMLLHLETAKRFSNFQITFRVGKLHDCNGQITIWFTVWCEAARFNKTQIKSDISSSSEFDGALANLMSTLPSFLSDEQPVCLKHDSSVGGNTFMYRINTAQTVSLTIICSQSHRFKLTAQQTDKKMDCLKC